MADKSESRLSNDTNIKIDTSIENLKTLYPVQGNRSIQPSEIHTKVSNSSSSTTSTTENNIHDTCKTTENVHTDNNNLGSSESGKYDILMLHDSICREIDIQRLLRNSQSQMKGLKLVAYTAV